MRHTNNMPSEVQIENTRKLASELGKVISDKQPFVIALTMAFMNGIESGMSFSENSRATQNASF